MSDKYIFHYFKVNGRGAVARAILSSMKADWTDHAFSREEWPSIKKSGLCEFEQAPVLEYKGKTYAQSMAIDFYLARKFNLMGKDDEENYEIESLMCCMEDIFSAMFKFTHLPESEKDKYDELRKVALERYKFFIKKIEERYVKHGKGKYFLGDRFTLCDILVGAQLPAFCDRFNEQVVPQVSPTLAELIKRLMNEELKEFHEKYFYKTQH